jgi:catechol 2,3-dioxygenase-like lactoylglutathione lyase family enzyme
MARKAAKKAKPAKKAKTTAAPKSRKIVAAKLKKVATKPVALQGEPASAGKLSFNHAMIYVKDVSRALGFYRDMLGFKLIEDFKFENQPVYARLRAPGGDGTIALHMAGPGAPMASDGVRLYFEVGDVDDFCHKLQKKGFYITQMPRMMPWGWRHAYLNDPDGHEISLYWAGEKRMQKTVMQAAKTIEKTPLAKSR